MTPSLPDGTPSRVQHRGHGLAMARSIGDHVVKEVGVIAEPVVTAYEISDADALVLIASDIKWSKQSVQLLGHTDTIFVGLFTIELLVKVLGLSLSDTWSDMWNRLDVIVVLLSYVAMALEAAFASLGSGVAALRALRLLRLLRLLRAIRAFGKISGASMKTRVLSLARRSFSNFLTEKYTWRQLKDPFASHGESLDEYSEPIRLLRVLS